MNLDEQSSNFYDKNYFEAMRQRHLSNAHRSRIKNVLSVIGEIKGLHILDVGCGDGWITNELAKLRAIVTGIDFSEDSIDFAKSQYPNLNFRVGSAYDLSQFAPQSFDGVTLIDVIGHTQNLKKVFHEIKRVLKPSGFTVVSEDQLNWLWHQSPFAPLIRKSLIFSKDGRAYLALKKSENVARQIKNYHVSQINNFSCDQLESLLTKNGFEVVDHRVYPIVGVPLRDFFLRLLPKQLRGDHQCLKCVKKRPRQGSKS